jgi:hypothetical protein
MHFNLLTLSLSILVSCGSGSPRTQAVGIIGEKLGDLTPLLNATGIQASQIYLVDKPTNRILKVDLASLNLMKSHEISRPGELHSLASGADGSYVIDFSNKHLEIIGSNGERQDRPFAFQGTPVSAAFNGATGTFVMQDDLQSIGLMLLASDGTVLKSWLGGPLFGTDKSLVAGDIDSSGRLILATSDKSIVMVDVEKSVDAKNWEFTSFDSKLDGINWIAPDSSQDDLSLVVSNNEIAVLNVKTQVITERLDLALGDILTETNPSEVLGKIALEVHSLVLVGKSKLGKPHVFIDDVFSDRTSVVYINSSGKLAQHELPNTGRTKQAESFLNTNAEELTVLISADNSQRVTKLRISDNLVVLDEKIEVNGDVKLGKDTLFINRNSPLGYLEAYDLSDMASRKLTGFNFEYFLAHPK